MLFRKKGYIIHNQLKEVFVLPNQKSLYIRPEALKKMSRYKQVERNSTEGGGILIGRILEEDGNYIIDDVTEPMPSDRRKRTRFSRKPDGHQEYFNEVWSREKGRCFYLGEWHTHPENTPTPSYIDKKDWSRLIKMEYESGCLFFIIIGIEEIKVWYGAEDEIIELKRRN